MQSPKVKGPVTRHLVWCDWPLQAVWAISPLKDITGVHVLLDV